jgi:hypothetical protein
MTLTATSAGASASAETEGHLVPRLRLTLKFPMAFRSTWRYRRAFNSVT